MYMEDSLRILCEQVKNLKEDYFGLVECCSNILEFSKFINSPERNIHNKPLARHIHNKINKLYRLMSNIKNKVNKL